MTPAEREARDMLVLSFDPFQDDAESRTLADKMVVTRKAHECHNCLETIPVGTRVRSMTQTWDGDIGTWRWCPVCCDAIADEFDPAKWDDETGLPPYEARNARAMRARAARAGGQP